MVGWNDKFCSSCNRIVGILAIDTQREIPVVPFWKTVFKIIGIDIQNQVKSRNIEVLGMTVFPSDTSLKAEVDSQSPIAQNKIIAGINTVMLHVLVKSRYRISIEFTRRNNFPDRVGF